MKYTYSLTQRLVAHTLLLSLFLQSCFNQSVPLPQIQVDKTQEISQNSIIKTKTNKFQANLDIQESTSSTSNQVVQPGLSSDSRDDSMPTSSRNNLSHTTSAPANGTLDAYTQQRIKVQPKRSSPLGQISNKRTYTHETQSTRQANQLATQPEHRTSKHPSKKVDKTFVHKLVQEDLPEQDPIVSHELQASATPLFIEETPFYAAQGGYQVKFMRNEQGWIAFVQDTFSDVFRRSFYLPVYQQGISIKALDNHTPLWLKHHIHVCPPEKDTKSGKGHVYVGNQGLLGGVKTPLHEAIEKGDVGYKEYYSEFAHKWIEPNEGAIRLIRDYPRYLFEQDEQGATPLHRAVCCVIHNKPYKVKEGLFGVRSAVIQPLTYEELIQAMISKGAHVNATDNNNQTPLHWAVNITKGDNNSLDSHYSHIIRKLIELGANPNIIDKDGYTPLHLAAAKGRVDIVKLLIDLGADKNAKVSWGITPLHLAVAYSKADIVMQLIAAGADINARDRDGRTALWLATMRDSVGMFELLISLGADKNAKDDNRGATPLHAAIWWNCARMVKRLIELGVDINAKASHGESPLHAAADSNNLELVKELIKFGANKDAQDKSKWTPLHGAAFNGHIDTVKELIALGANKEAKSDEGATPLFKVVYSGGSIEMVKLLLSLGADKNTTDERGFTLLHEAVNMKHVELVKYLITQGLSINSKSHTGQTPIHIALKKEDKLLSQQLLSALGVNSNIHAADGNGRTWLHRAVVEGDQETTKLLIEAGVDKNPKDKSGNTPLYLALEKGNVEMVRQLVNCQVAVDKNIQTSNGLKLLQLIAAHKNPILSKQLLSILGIDIAAKDQRGYTPLHHAVLQNNTQLIELLIGLGVDINAKDNQENTPLHLAVERGDMSMVEQLVKLGAAVHVSNNQGLYPVHLAIVRGNTAIARKLITYTHINVTDNKQSNTPLHWAIYHNNLDLIKGFVQAGAALHQTNRDGLTPIDLASCSNNLEYVPQIFAISSSQLNTVGSDGLSHIHRAIKRKDLQLVRQLLSTQSIDINLKDKQGRTPLHMVVEQGDLVVMKLLVSAGAKKDSKDNNGKTPIHLALQNTNPLLAKQLLSVLGVDMHAQDQEGYTLLHRMVFDNDISSFKQLVALGCNPNVKDKHEDTPLHRAIRKHAVDLVKQLIEIGVDINAKGQNGETPLHVAASYHNQTIVKLLIEAGAAIEARSANENTPLYEAIRSGNEAIIRLLINAGAGIETRNYSGYTPLHGAVYFNQEAVIQLLIELGANKNAKNTSGDTPLHYAIKNGKLAIVKHLVEKGADLPIKNDEGLTPIDLASVSGRLDCVSQIFSIPGMDVNTPSADGTTHMQRAVERGDLKLLQQLLSCGADKTLQDSAKNTLLHIAISKGQLAIVKYLVEQGADLQVKNVAGLTPIDVASVSNHLDYIPQIFPTQPISQVAMLPHLHQAIARGDVSLLKQLFGCGASKSIQDQAGNTLLHTAIQQGQLDIAKYFVEMGADLYARNQAGLTPIDLTSTSNHLDYVASIFAIQGIDINAADAHQMTHLHRAVERGDEKLVQQLIACQADVAVADNTGATPLHHAAMKGDTTLLQHLQVGVKSNKSWFNIFSKQGSPVDIPDNQGNTPLHLAMEQGHLAATQFLLQEKADLYAKNKKGLTPIHQALATKQYGLLKALLIVPGCSPLHMAAAHHDIDLIKQLLAIGVDIDTVDSTGKTLLYVAFEKKDSVLTKQLIELGAKVNGQDSQGRTMLHHALAKGDILIATALLAAEADIYMADQEGLTPLHLAAQYNLIAVAKQLIHLGARMNEKDNQDRTPLHVAAHQGHSSMAQFLIQSGADLHAVDKQKFIPLDLSLQQGKLELVEAISAAYEYKLHTWRCVDRIRKHMGIPFGQDTAPIETSWDPSTLAANFIEGYVAQSPVEEQATFKSTIAPIVQKQLPQIPISEQLQMIQYWENGGSFYPAALQAYPVQGWVRESLILDIGQEALASKDEVMFAKFQEHLSTATQHYTLQEIEKLLLAIREKQLAYQLDLPTIIDILIYVSLFGASQALSFLQLTDPYWLASLQLAWFHEQAKVLSHFTPSQRHQISYAARLLLGKPELAERFIVGLRTEKEFDQLKRFFAFLSKYKVSETSLLMAFYKKPPEAEASRVQAWQHYIACELLKNKLVQLFPMHATQLERQAYLLFRQGVEYEDMVATLEHLSTQPDKALQAQPLIEAWDLLIAYGVEEKVCKEALHVIRKRPTSEWEKEIHALVINATFGKAYERTVEEVIDYVVTKSPQAHFVNDKEELNKSYQAVLTAYQNTSKLFPITKTPIAKWSASDIAQWAQQVKGSKALKDMSPAIQHEVLAVIRQAAKLQHGYFPRITQLLALLLYLNHAPGKGRLGQINTGEGKSLIVAMLAAVFGLQGKQVDVVTTSVELSKPAVDEQKSFFEMLGLSVDENSHKDTKREAYQRDIVYGTAGNFQGDILRTEFLGKDIRGTRGFGVVIVDEVDSMLFDSRRTSVRIAGQTPAMHHLELLLGAVYSQVYRMKEHIIEKDGQSYYIHEDFKINEGEITTFSEKPLQLEPIEDKKGFIIAFTKRYVERLLRTLEGDEWKEWQEHKRLNEAAITKGIEVSNEENEEKREELEKECQDLNDKLKHTGWSKKDRFPVVEVPAHLREFAFKQITNWIESAIQAIYFCKKELHYDVCNGKIVPIDYDNTGVLQNNMVWSNGLAQMLQIKEGLLVEPEGIATNFLSVPEYFNRYGHAIYGLTGTLGNEATKQFLTEIYQADQFILPPYQLLPIAGNEHSHYVCKELPAIVVPTPQEWYEAICSTSLRKARNQRAVLVICKYIDQVKKVAQLLREQYDEQKILTYTGQENFNKKSIEAGEIIVATNIAGRGTDITTLSEVEAHGGLHVCITFLPESYRVELQNAGRTARQGKKGTAQLVIQADTSLADLKAERDAKEEKAINRAKGDVKNMCFKDRMFGRFCALESELLPTTDTCKKAEQSKKLEERLKCQLAELQKSGKIETMYKQQEEVYLLLKKHVATSQEEDKAFEQVKKISREALNKRFEKAILEKICNNEKGKIPGDVLEKFRNRQSFVADIDSLASKYDWGQDERDGLEERWGIWLHHALEDKIDTDEPIVQQDFDKFAVTIRQDATQNLLIKNPYYYIKKGNNLLKYEHLDEAIAAYDKAIDLDELHSANARYYKALALLSYKDNKDNFDRAQYNLERAKILLATHHKPQVISFHAMVSQTGDKPQLLDNIQHQIDILIKQESYIDAALKEIAKAKREEWDLEVSGRKTLEDVFQDDTTGVNRSAAIEKAHVNGLNLMFVLKAQQPYPWKSIIALACLGIAQVAVGVLAFVYSGGTTGLGLINEGISDLIASAKAGISGTFSWAQWGIQKAISIAVSLVASGIKSIKETIQGAKVVEGAAKDGLKDALKYTALTLGKGVAKELTTSALNHVSEKLIIENIEGWIEKEVTKKLEEKLSQHELILKALSIDVDNKSNYWQQLLINEGMAILTQTDGKFMQFLKGTACGLIKQAMNEVGEHISREGGSGKAFKLVCQGGAMLHASTEILAMTGDFFHEWTDQVACKYSQDIEKALQAQQAKKEQEEHAAKKAKTPLEKKTTTDLIAQGSFVPETEEGDIEGVQVDKHTNYSSNQTKTGSQARAFYYAGASTQQGVCKAFATNIQGKITNKIQADLLQPVTSGIASWGVEKLSKGLTDDVNKALEGFRTQNTTHRLGKQ